MTDTAELIERLRASICENKCKVMLASSGCDCAASADALETLQAENERLMAFAYAVLQHGPYNWQNSARAALGAKP